MDNEDCILVVDDDPTFLAILSGAFKKRGYPVLSAETVSEALEKSSIQVPDYAVVDLKLGAESGLDVITPLKQLNPAMKILILTGYSSIATAVAAIKAGAFDYACKPLDAEQILEILAGQGRADKPGLQEEPVSVQRLQWEHIQRVLNENNGNISATARSLGMHRRTLQRKLQKRPVRR